ncbi:MAG TPA: hypothetical protein VMW16_15165 [Sedimentisphaerales bacterium]|nr:hypothetical protein [Sedimentisphaerales bacterium]
MVSDRIFTCMAAALFPLLLAAGCAPSAKGPVKTGEPELVLKFTPQDLTTYRLITEETRGVQFEGSLGDDATLKGGRTGDRVEMTFTQQIQGIDSKGNATAKITIKNLKYFAQVKDRPVLDFDSSKEKDQSNPLAKLIGQSYTIEITPDGQVAQVTDFQNAQSVIKGGTLPGARGLALLAPDAIKERHTISALAIKDKKKVRPGDSWSSIKTFSFGLMGTKSYERVYTLEEIKDVGNRRIAAVEMKAIPTSETAAELHKEQPTSDFSKMFDSNETYAGQLELNLTDGKVEKYDEKLHLEWIIVDPTAKQKGNKEPDTLKMGTTQLYSLERID